MLSWWIKMKLVNSYMECMRYLFIPAKCLICERGMQNYARVHPLSHGNFCINSKYSWFKHNLSSVPTFQLNSVLALKRWIVPNISGRYWNHHSSSVCCGQVLKREKPKKTDDSWFPCKEAQFRAFSKPSLLSQQEKSPFTFYRSGKDPQKVFFLGKRPLHLRLKKWIFAEKGDFSGP